MTLDFIHDGERGQIVVSCVPNTSPAAVGKGDEALGFPMCTATVEYPGEGYRAFFGWVQLVRSSDNRFGGRAFEMDPLRFFEDAPSPYCLFGQRPVLFDAPSRDTREPLEWLAHAFFAVTPRRDGPRTVVPLAGFSWGFDIRDGGAVEIRPVERLGQSDWDAHLAYLGDYYRTWDFEAGSL